MLPVLKLKKVSYMHPRDPSYVFQDPNSGKKIKKIKKSGRGRWRESEGKGT